MSEQKRQTRYMPAPALGDQRSIDLDVLAYALGGDGTSQFYRKYRYEKQLVDSISVGNMSLNRAGLFYMVAQLDADKVEPFWQEFTRDLAALDAGKISFYDCIIINDGTIEEFENKILSEINKL